MRFAIVLLVLLTTACAELAALGESEASCPDPETGSGWRWNAADIPVPADLAIRDASGRTGTLAPPITGLLAYAGESSQIGFSLANGLNLAVRLPPGRDLFAAKTGERLTPTLGVYARNYRAGATCSQQVFVTGTIEVLEATGAFDPKTGTTSDFRRRFRLELTGTNYGCGVTAIEGKLELDLATWSLGAICPTISGAN